MHLGQKDRSHSAHRNFASSEHDSFEHLVAFAVAMSAEDDRCLMETCKNRSIKRRRASTVSEEIKQSYGSKYTDASIQDGLVCNRCYTALKKGKVAEPETIISIDETKCVEYLLKNFGQFSDGSKGAVIDTIGNHCLAELRQFSESCRNEIRTVNSLASFDGNAYLQSSPGVVHRLIESMSTHKTETKMKVRALESLCQLSHRNFISPFSFKQATLISSMTNSKTSRLVLNACLPAGCPGGIDTLLEKSGLSNEPPVLPSHCDVVCAFDNQQVIGRQYSIVAFKSNPVSKCTAVLHAFTKDSVLQLYPENDLAGYLGPGHSKARSARQLADITSTTADERLLATRELKQLFGESLNRIEEERNTDFDFYLRELGEVVDKVDFQKSCLRCGTPSEGANRKLCKNKDCRAQLMTATEAALYVREAATRLRGFVTQKAVPDLTDPSLNHIPSGDRLSVLMINDDPLFSEPNSYASCTRILRELGKRLEISYYGKGFRQFAVLACDGQPYALIMKIIKNHIVCSECKMELWGSELYDAHKRNKHLNRGHPEYEFSWVLLQMGYGHYEMNFMRMAITLFWDQYFSRACWIMNFRSEKAQETAKKASDTHKAFELFNIMRYSLMFELMDNFLDEKSNLQEATFEGFEAHARNHSSANIRNAWVFLRDVLQPLFVFRAGVRKNNPSYINLGMKLGLPVFFASNSKKYQQIVLHHLVTRSLLPPPINDYLAKTQSMGEWGQGMDFKLEEKNRLAKKFLSCVSTEKDWTRVYRALDPLDKVVFLGFVNNAPGIFRIDFRY